MAENKNNQIDFIIKKINLNSMSLLGIMIILSISLFSISKFSKSKSILVNNTIRNIVPINEIRIKSLEVLTGYRMFIAGKGKNTLEYITAIGVSKREYDKQIKILLENKELNKKVNIKEMNDNFNKVISIGKDMAVEFMQKNFKEASIIVQRFNKETKKFENELAFISKSMTKMLIHENLKSVQLATIVQKIFFTIIPFLLILTLIITFKLLKKVKLTLIDETKSISGQISIAVNSLSDSSINLQNISLVLAKTNDSFILGSDKQQSATKDSITVVNEILDMSDKTSQYASSSIGISKNCQVMTEKGRTVVVQMADAMEEIDKSNLELLKISEIMKAIFKKIEVINDIVFQAKLLSFNANVEAARAGKYGTGFSVVAQEVSVLAKQSGASSNEISLLIKDSGIKVDQIIQNLQNRVSFGKKVSIESVEMFSSIQTMNVELSSTINQIKDTIERQNENLHKSFSSFQIIETSIDNNLKISNKTKKYSQDVIKESEKITKNINSLNKLDVIEKSPKAAA